eukprot:scaffold60140_cov55-Attheya_sp.AAC.2
MKRAQNADFCRFEIDFNLNNIISPQKAIHICPDYMIGRACRPILGKCVLSKRSKMIDHLSIFVGSRIAWREPIPKGWCVPNV